MDAPENRIRRYVDEQGGSTQVPFHNLLTTWGLASASEADADRIGAALRGAGLTTQPALRGLGPDDRVTLLVEREPPPWDMPEAVAPAAQAPTTELPPTALAPARITPAEIVGLALGAGGALLAFIASFLPWIGFFEDSSNYWELAEAADFFLTLLTFGAIGVTAAVFAFPRVRVLRLVLLALIAGVLAGVLVDPIEFMSRHEDDFSTIQAGEILALFAAALLIAGTVLQVLALRAQGEAAGGRSVLVLVGLITLCVVGFLQPLFSLLPFESGVSAWEENRVGDILDLLISLSLAGLALAAILAPRAAGLVPAVFILGSYYAIGDFVSSIDSLAAEANGAAVFLRLFLLAPLAATGTVLLAIGSRLLR